jgi:two-component sensor histidine kinase
LVEEFHELADRQDSFPAEYRIVRPDGTIRWLSGRGQVVARGMDGKAQRLVNVAADITERKVAENHIQFLMRELTHRSKNLLAVVQGIAGQTMRTAGTIDEFRKKFMQRLQGLAASHDLLVNRNWQGASLADLVRDQLAPFAEVGSARLHVSGPDILVSPEAAQAIGLALHELATNAVKYGALSVPIGQVTVFWALENHGTELPRLRLNWAEQNGPLVTPPTHKGFGHLMFAEMIAKQLNGKIATNFAPQGLNWELSIPTANLVTERDENFEPSSLDSN